MTAIPSTTGQALAELQKARKIGIAPAVLPPTSRFVRVPGACASSACTPLRLVGMSSSVSRVSAVRGVEDVTSTMGDALDTVMVSLNEPSFRDVSILAGNPAASPPVPRPINLKPPGPVRYSY